MTVDRDKQIEILKRVKEDYQPEIYAKETLARRMAVQWAIDLAIQVRDGKLVTEEEVFKKCEAVAQEYQKRIREEYTPNTLVGKLSTPRLTDWEKVLPTELKIDWDITNGNGDNYKTGFAHGWNDYRKACLSALKSMSEPRLTDMGIIKELIDTCEASTAETDISDKRKEYRKDLLKRAKAL